MKSYSRPSRCAKTRIANSTNVTTIGAVELLGTKARRIVRIKTGCREFRREFERFCKVNLIGRTRLEFVDDDQTRWGHTTAFDVWCPDPARLDALEAQRWCVSAEFCVPTRVMHSFGSGPEKVRPSGPSRKFVKPELPAVCPAEAPPADDIDVNAPDAPRVEPFKLPDAKIVVVRTGDHVCPASA